MIITDRDRKIINFIEKCNIATTKNIAELFFNNGSKNYHIVALRRLNKLVQYGKLKSRPANLHEHGRPMTIFYIDKPPSPKSLRHCIAVSNLATELVKNEVDIIEIESPEIYITDKIRVDAIFKVTYNNKKRLFVLEYEYSKKFNTTKYEYMYTKQNWKDKFKQFPRIVCISNESPIRSNMFNIIHLKPDLSNINILLNDLN